MYQPRRQFKYLGKPQVISIDVNGEKQNLKIVEQFKYQTFKHKENNGGECMDSMNKDIRKRIDLKVLLLHGINTKKIYFLLKIEA